MRNQDSGNTINSKSDIYDKYVYILHQDFLKYFYEVSEVKIT